MTARWSGHRTRTGARKSTAVVELNENCSVTEQELIALCKQELGSIRAPKSVHLVPSLPRSVNGKVLKKNIREAFWRDEKTKI